MIKTFAIETSCDDTSLGIVTFDGTHFSCPILKAYSQVADHQQYGGVVPELAYRLHEEKIVDLVADIGYSEIAACDHITVTKLPGLPGSLVVGNTVASMLGGFYQKPIYRVNHIYGHIFSLLLERSRDEVPLPWIVLTASGGHNELYYVTSSQGILSIEKLGYSLDDAAGEAFDKVSRMIGGPYPGGPWISAKALEHKQKLIEKSAGNQMLDEKAVITTSGRFTFKRILLDGMGKNKTQEERDQNIFNFSFSGMKSQAHQLLQQYPLETLTEDDIAEMCWEFQECVVDTLVHKMLGVSKHYGANTIGIVGGVSASDRLYEKAKMLTEVEVQTKNDMNDIKILRPVKKVYSTDNAAMIGVVGILEHLGLL